MRRMSLRGWLLLVSILFSVLVVGGIALTSYVIVSDGMRSVALDTTQRLANASDRIVNEEVAYVEAALSDGADTEAERLSLLVSRLPQAFARFEAGTVAHTLYDAQLNVIWSSATQPAVQGQARARQSALATGERTSSAHDGGSLISGLVTQARLGATIMHLPVALPGGAAGVLDVAYLPRAEERVINAVRGPMSILAISAMLIMVVLVHTSMSWVLHLVDDLRKAADSIDAGRLDERLPESGENEIGELARSLNRLIDRLERRSTAQARFVADASHELATPVAGIRGYTSILRAWGGEDATVRAEAIDAIDRESRRMARLTSDLLNLLHADQGLRLTSERFDLNALVRNRIAATAGRYLEKDIEYVGPDETTQFMVGDAERIDDVLSILLDNAAKYTPEGGRISIDTYRAREVVTIRVTDSGAGIPLEDQARIFDRFFRSDKARAAGEGGFGLGLAIAKSIVSSMNGEISLHSLEGRGTTFTITVPRGRL